MSDTVRQLAEREAAASRVMARADQLAALSETGRRPDPGLSVAGTSAGQPAGGPVDAGRRHDGMAGQRR